MLSFCRRAPLAVLAAALAAAPVPAVHAAPTASTPAITPPPSAGLQGAPPAPLTGTNDEPRDFAGPTEIPVAEPTPEELYAEGERAYFIGDYVTAVTKFETAYAKSQLPQLLYNVGLAYMRRYELSKDVADLRRAHSVLTNFRVELERDPTIGSAQNVEELLSQIDRSLAAHVTQPRKLPAPTAVTKDTRPAAACPDPAPPRTIIQQADTRRGGAVLMTLGGLSLAAGVASGLGFALKGRQFRGQLTDVTAMQQAACDAGASTCPALTESVAITKSNGHTANILAGTLGGGLTALGVASLVAGAVLYARPGKRPDRRARIQAGPSLGGVWLRGAF